MIDIMTKKQRKEILTTRCPESPFPPQPMFGAWYTEDEIRAAVKAVRDSMDWRVGFGGGKEIKEFEEAFAEYIGTDYAVAINGAGTGLDMAIMCLDLEPGDEVICPGANFYGSHMAILDQGGKLILCEVDETFNPDPNDVERKMTPRTRAIFPVHLFGLSSPLDDLLDIAERHPHAKHGPPKVIGDAARACGGTYRGTKIGKKGWMTVFSFHTQKQCTTLGEGGMISTDDPCVAERAAAMRCWGNYGRSPWWGSNYQMTKVQAAVGMVQLRRLDEMVALRVKRARQRTELLKDIPELTLPYDPPDCLHTYYFYHILLPREWAGEKRNHLTQILKEEYLVECGGGHAGWKHWQYIAERTKGQELPRTEALSQRCFIPGLNPRMTEEENKYICAAIAEAVERVRDET